MPLYNVPVWVQVQAENEAEAEDIVADMDADELAGGNVGDACEITI